MPFHFYFLWWISYYLLVLFAIDMRMFYKSKGDAFEGETLLNIYCYFFFYFFKFDLAVSYSSASLWLIFLTWQEVKIRWKSLWVKIKGSLTNYCSGQKRFNLEKMNVVYCKMELYGKKQEKQLKHRCPISLFSQA